MNKPNQEYTLEASKFDEIFLKNKIERKVFSEWLKTNTYIEVDYSVSRDHFNNLKGDFLVEKGETKDGIKKYKLFLPKDLKIGELAGIILRINKITYQDEIPKHAISQNIKAIFEKAIFELLKLKRKHSGTKEEKRLEKSISKYIKIYEKYFPQEDLSKFSSENLDNQIFNHYPNLQQIRELGNLEKTNSVIEAEREIDDWLSDNMKSGIDIAIFEKAKQTLFNFMQTFTNEDYEDVKGEKDVHFRFTKFFDEVEQDLKDAIGIEEAKKELDLLRKNGDKQEIIKKEKEVIQKILYVIVNNYPRNNSSDAKENAGNSSPINILENKEMVCVGKSILSHVFLEYLGIKHYGANLPGHSALVVELSNKEKYYFDATNLQSPKKIQLNEKNKNGDFYYIPGLYHSDESYNKLSIGNPEMVLIGHINNNKGNALYRNRKYKEALIFIEKAEKSNPSNIDFLIFKIDILEKLGKYEEALYTFIKVKEKKQDTIYIYANRYLSNTNYRGFVPGTIDQHIDYIYKKCKNGFNKEYYMGMLSMYFKSNKYFEKALEYTDQEAHKYIEIGDKIENNPELALKAYNIAINKDPSNKIYYSKRGFLLVKLGKSDKALKDFSKLGDSVFTKLIKDFISDKKAENGDNLYNYLEKKGSELINNQNYEDGLTIFLGLKKIKDDLYNLSTILRLYYKIEDYEKSLSYINQILEDKSFNRYTEHAYQLKAIIFFKKGYFHEAIEICNQLLSKDPNNQKALVLIEEINKYLGKD